MIKTERKCLSQKGSVFFYVLLGVVLFATLAFTVSRSMRGQATNSMTDRQAELVASDIISYAQAVERAVGRVLRNGFSESEISFYSPQADTTFSGSRYLNNNCTVDECLVFNSKGGGVKWQNPPQNAADYSWHFTHNHRIPSYGGTGHAGVVMHLVGVNQTLCEILNKKLGHDFSSIPVFSSTADSSGFTGNFAPGKYIGCSGSLCAGKTSMCLQYSPAYSGSLGEQYVFYHGVYVMPD